MTGCVSEKVTTREAIASKNVEEVMLRCVWFVKEINFDPTNFNPAFFGGRGGVGPIFISHKSSNVLEIR